MITLPPLPGRKIPSWRLDSLTVRPCPICRKDNAAVYLRPDRLEVSRCLGCGLYYVRTIPAPSELAALYETYWSDYRPGRPGKQQLCNFRPPFLTALNKFIDLKGAKVLDVGSGLGENLFYLKKVGALGRGVEINKQASDFVNRHGITVYNDDFLSVDFNEKFDVIIMADILEHPVEPLQFLHKAWSLLDNQGLLVIQTPNGYINHHAPYDDHYFLKVDFEHLQFFNAACFHHISQQLSLEIEFLLTWGYPAFGVPGPEGGARSRGWTFWQRARSKIKRIPWLTDLWGVATYQLTIYLKKI